MPNGRHGPLLAERHLSLAPECHDVRAPATGPQASHGHFALQFPLFIAWRKMGRAFAVRDPVIGRRNALSGIGGSLAICRTSNSGSRPILPAKLARTIDEGSLLIKCNLRLSRMVGRPPSPALNEQGDGNKAPWLAIINGASHESDQLHPDFQTCRRARKLPEGLNAKLYGEGGMMPHAEAKLGPI